MNSRAWLLGALGSLLVACSSSSSSDGAGGATSAAGAGGTATGGQAGEAGASGQAQSGASSGGQAGSGGQAQAGSGGQEIAGSGGQAQAGSGGQAQGGAGGQPVNTKAGDLDPQPFGGERPVKLFVPGNYQAGTPTPLVLLLHGYQASGAIQDAYLGFTGEANAHGVLYAYPDGTIDPMGKRFWNATNACCDLYNSKVDDVAYLTGLVAEIQQRYTVDPKRIFLVGHSNGGFMSHRLACEHAELFAGIVSLAGATWSDASKCQPTQPVAVLQVHGDMDDTIAYGGSAILGQTYPGAQATVESWAKLDGCALTPDDSAPALDLESTLLGDETKVRRYAQGCQGGSVAELWTIQGGKHIPSVYKTFARGALDFLLAHPRP